MKPLNPTFNTGLNRRQCLRWSVGLGVGLNCAVNAAWAATRNGSQAAPTLVWHERALIGFGTTLWLRAGHADGAKLESALNAAVAVIRDIERSMSLFDANSALSTLNRLGQLARPDPHLLAVSRLAQQVAQRSGGAFDVTMQPLWDAWATAQGQGGLPTAAAVQRARSHIGWANFQVGDRQLRLARPGMAVSLNGIAQGYAADQVRHVLHTHGVEHAVLDTGEWLPMGRSPEGEDWRIRPVATVRNAQGASLAVVSDGRAVATSSDAQTSFSPDHRHHHILDPRTGYSPTAWASVSVVAKSCALADALTKVMFMATPTSALATARAWQVDALWVAKTGEWVATPGMPLRPVG
jgi:FAD:protein FMN transferase